jgi:molecular chaperone DnaK
MGKIIGIDLGTTNSAMAVMEGGTPVIIANAEGTRTTPSMVAVSKSGERLVGQVAKRQSVINPDNTIFEVKRLIGRKASDAEIKKDEKLMPYKIVESGETVKVKMGDKDFSPEEVSAMILSKLKADAEAFLGETITEAVITVPAYFNDAQRQATKDAGKIAGLEVKRIINEPTAAALAYGLEKKKDEKVVVYDLGGGTFDVSILEIGMAEGEDSVVEVLSTNGDTHLGGADFDQVVMHHLIEQFKSQEGMDLSNDKAAVQRLKEAAEKAKIELSSTNESEINLPFITADANGPKHFQYNLTRAKLESLVSDLIAKTGGPCEAALKDAGLKASDIDEVVLVGGMTRMPAVQAQVEKIFGKKPLQGVNPDEVVAVGAAVQGGVLSGDVKGILLLDVTPLSLGLETMGGVFTKLIERNTTIPASKSQVFSTAADSQTQVEINVLQGEREFANDNKSLGRFILDGVAPAPRGIPQIEVTFNIDANGIVNVKASDKGTGKEQHITIQNSGNLSEDDVKRMQQEAEAHADEDKVRKDLVESKNQLDSTIYTAERTLKDGGEKATPEDKEALEQEITAAKSKLESTDKDELEKAAMALSEAMQKVGAAMYASPDGNPAPGTEGAPEEVEATEADGKTSHSDGDDVTEAEVVDKGGKK